MAKPRHDEPTISSNTTLAILVAGGVLVAALVVWALTRTVEPSSTVDTTTFATTTAPAADPGSVATDISSTGTQNPLVSTASSAVPPSPPAGDKSTVTRIAAEDLRAQQKRGEVTIIDVRDSASYAREHIPGALNMPLATVEAQIDTLPKGKAIVTYCT